MMEQLRAEDESHAHHVCLNALNGTQGGGITVVRNLAEQLPRLRPNWRFTLLHSHPDAAPADPASNLALEYRGELQPVLRRWTWEQFMLPIALARGRYDLMLCVGGFTCFGTGGAWGGLQQRRKGPDHSMGSRRRIQASARHAQERRGERT